MASGVAAVLIAAVAPAAAADVPLAVPLEVGTTDSPLPGHELAWSDEFSGSRLNEENWFYREDSRGASVQTARNVSVSDGLLKIKLDKNKNAKEGDLPYSAGGVISKQEFRYGYYETRAQLNKGPGWHPAFWRMGYIGEETCTERLCYKPGHPRFPTSEIDGFEWESNASGHITHNLHEWDWNGAGIKHVTSGASELGFDPSDGFHIYGFEFTEDKVVYYVDGVRKYETLYPYTGHFHDFASIWLTAVALPATAGAVDETQLPAEVQFDYIRYYKRGHYVANIEDGMGFGADGQVSKTGTWFGSSLSGFTRTRTEYSNVDGSTYTWSAELPVTGEYDVYVYNVQQAGSDPAARYVVDQVADREVVIDQASTPTGWVSLGTFELEGAQSHSVTLTRGSGYSRADHVKFVPKVDGPPVEEKSEYILFNAKAGGAYVSDGSTASTGTWLESGLLGYNGSKTEYSSEASASYTWKATVARSGTYEVQVYNIQSSTSDPSATYIVNGDSSTGVTLDQSTTAAGWTSIGTFELVSQQDTTITLNRGSANARVNAVKIVWIED